LRCSKAATAHSFCSAALHGAVLVPVWVAAVFGWVALPVEMEVSWHTHQMVYGFAAAGLAGFMLTAVPNWTGASPLRGAPLAALALLWLVGRLAMTLTTVFLPRVAAGIDLAFIPALALGVIGPLLAAGKTRNLMLLVPLSVLSIGDWMMQAQFIGTGEDTAGTGSRVGIDVMLLMIAVIGGRIIPRPSRPTPCAPRAVRSRRSARRSSTVPRSPRWRC